MNFDIPADLTPLYLPEPPLCVVIRKPASDDDFLVWVELENTRSIIHISVYIPEKYCSFPKIKKRRRYFQLTKTGPQPAPRKYNNIIIQLFSVVYYICYLLVGQFAHSKVYTTSTRVPICDISMLSK